MGTTELEDRMVKKTSFTRATRKITRLGRRCVISRGTRSSRRRLGNGQEARDGVRRKPAGSATGRACSTEASVLPPPKTPTSWQGARVGKQRHGQGPGNAGRGRDRGQQPGTPRERSADPPRGRASKRRASRGADAKGRVLHLPEMSRTGECTDSRADRWLQRLARAGGLRCQPRASSRVMTLPGA